MTEESTSDAGSGGGKTRTVTTHASATTSMTATATVAFSADNIRDRLDDDEYALALVLTATRLENVLTRGLRQRLDTNKEQFENLWGNKTLGTYGQMCSQLGVFEDEFKQHIIDDVAGLRNNLVHDYGYLDDIEEDEDLQDEVEDAIEDAIEFIESVEI